ncbi:MAG: hypothetical protein RIR83_1822 [Pseudomonadota bacterium]
MHKHIQKFSLCIGLLSIFLLSPIHANMPAQDLLEAPISLQFTDIEVTELLQALAKITNTNFLLSESIKGRITIELRRYLLDWSSC